MWWAVFGHTLSTGLHALYTFFAGSVISVIGPYGVAIIVLTIGIKLLLSPLYQLQLSLSRKSMLAQRKIAPELAEARKKYKGDPQKQQAEMMRLYKEHNVNPLGGLTGCLPAVLQIPILTALYYVFLGNAQHNVFPFDHFLFVPHLNQTPAHNALFAGLPIPALPYLIIPLMAAATTFVQSKMMQQPPNPMASEQEQQTQQMTQSMQVMMPLMIGYFAIVTPAGLGLYWFISNCFAIIQQYLVNGWGGLRRGGPGGPGTPTGGAPVTGPGGGPALKKPILNSKSVITSVPAVQSAPPPRARKARKG